MEKVIKIEGGHDLNGTVRISGSKNATVALIPACVLGNEPVTIYGVPNISDVQSLIVLLNELGVYVEKRDEETLYIDPTHMENIPMVSKAVSKLRASYYFMGALLGKFGHAEIKMPGGCYLGPRPIDLHLKGFEALGANIQYENGCYILDAKELKGTNIFLDISSVGATINIMMAAVYAKGRTVIENAAREPEVVDLARCLSAMGAHIEGAGTVRIVIEGVPSLHGCEYSVLPDRIETGTFLCAAVATRGDVLVTQAAPSTLDAVIDKLRACAVDIRTSPHPGFPTDMQAQFMAVNAVAEGSGRIVETIFENRFMHVPELQRMGADITVDGHTAVVRGVEHLEGANVMATDLRASASLVIAGLAARGQTVVDRIYHLDRGYEHIEQKLKGLGADIVRID